MHHSIADQLLNAGVMRPIHRVLREIVAKTGYMVPPRRVIVEVNHICNYRCRGCYLVASFDNQALASKGLERDVLKKIILQLPGSIRNIMLIGGEPLIRKDIETVCDIITSRNKTFSIFTNGSNFPVASRLLNHKGLAEMWLSLDGTTEINDELRAKGSYHAVMRLLNYAHEKGVNKKLRVTLVLSRENMEVVPQVLREIGTFKPSSLMIELLRLYTEAIVNQTAEYLQITRKPFAHLTLSESDKIRIEPSAIEHLLKSLADEKSGVTINIAPKVLAHDPQSVLSRQLRRNYLVTCNHLMIPRITYTGELIHCFNIKHVLGDLKTQPLRFIWNSQSTREFRRRLLANNLPPLCETCLHCSPLEP